MKYINFKRLNFSIITKYINNLRYYFLKIFKIVDLKRFNLKKIYKYFDFPIRVIIKIYKSINLRNYKTGLMHTSGFLLFAIFSYLLIPVFYKYDKSEIAKAICKDKEIHCSINGNVGYSLYPTPRINIYDLVIKDSSKGKNTLVAAKKVSLKLKIFNNLLNKKKHKFKKIELSNYDINFYLNNIKKYANIFKANTDYIPISFKDGKIIFLDKKDYVASVNKSNFDLVYKKNTIKIKIKGKFLDDNAYINLDTKKEANKIFSDIIIKISKLNLLAKANISNSKDNSEELNGNVLIRKDKNKITSIFEYKNSEINITKANLSNAFFQGESDGKIVFSPYFNFDIDINLNSINFTKLYNYFLSLDKNDKKKLFKINSKINGNIALSSGKVYSGYNLAKSFESRLKLNNGNIIIEQFIINLGKLGAADLLGKIDNTDNSSNLKFESNIFVDNQKKFLSKFGIYNKKNILPSLFVSGNFDLDDLNMHFYEIFYKENLSNEDMNYVENEFNNLMLEDGYETLFHFPQFKEFIKSITTEVN